MLSVGLLIFAVLGIRVAWEILSDLRAWRPRGWRVGHVRLKELPPDTTSLWLQHRTLAVDIGTVQCQVTDPNGDRTSSDLILVQRWKDRPEAGHFATLFPKSFLGAPRPLPSGSYRVEWWSVGDVAPAPIRRHRFAIRAGRIRGNSRPKEPSTGAFGVYTEESR